MKSGRIQCRNPCNYRPAEQNRQLCSAEHYRVYSVRIALTSDQLDEFVRLALEEAGADYVDITRDPRRGTGAMFEILESESEAHIPFAPPFLKHGDLIIPHVANILFYLGPRLGLAPGVEGLRHVANGLQLTVTDFVAEVHDTHHPVATSLYYEDQKPAARQRRRRQLCRCELAGGRNPVHAQPG